MVLVVCVLDSAAEVVLSELGLSLISGLVLEPLHVISTQLKGEDILIGNHSICIIRFGNVTDPLLD